MTTAVGVLGRTDDPHAATIARLSEAGGAKVTVMDTTAPSFSRWQLRAGVVDPDGGGRIDLQGGLYTNRWLHDVLACTA